MGEELVKRMRMRSRHFIALHLRFEPDMLTFSGCYYGGGEKERRELGAIRRRWKTLHSSNPDKERRQGKCPLTPEEVGLMLRELGFGRDNYIYVASGEVYGGEETLAPLKVPFPNFHTKDTLVSREELVPSSTFSSCMAALDFIVCDESDVFVTNNNGDMAKMLAGRSMTWEKFASGILVHQKGFMGVPNEIRPVRGEFHENPSICICENTEAKSKHDLGYQSWTKFSQKNEKSNNESINSGESTDDQSNYDEQDCLIQRRGRIRMRLWRKSHPTKQM